MSATKTRTYYKRNSLAVQQENNDRWQEIKAPLERLFELQTEWETDAREEPTAGPEYFEAIQDLAEVIDAGPLPREAMPLLGYLRDLYKTFLWNMAMPRRGKDCENALIEIQTRVVKFKEAYERRHARNTTPRKPLESIAVLSKQGVSEKQIALMHGLTYDQVLQEQRDPGSICGADYVAPSQQALDAEEKAEDQEAGSPEYERDLRVYVAKIVRARESRSWEDVRRELLSSPN